MITEAAGSSPGPEPVTTHSLFLARVWRHPLVPGSLLMLLALLAYLPALRCGFIWDDDVYVTQNPLLTDPHGLREIWFSAHTQSQYFPLIYTTFRWEHALWGFNPLGYHLVNILLHGVNAMLVWLVLRRLAVPGAWLAAAIFAVHPVEVETVAWIAELKNVESWLFYLLAVLGWIQFVDQPAPRRWPYYFLAALAYLLAMFAKTTACTLPAALVLVLWLRGERFTRWRALQLAPFLAVGLGMGLLTIWWEKHLGDYDESFGLSFGFTQRLLIASRALWFYAGKLLWPANLAFSYPRWNINPAEPWQYVPIVAGVVLALCLWLGRARIGRGVIAGIIFFVAALSPLIGFITEGTFHYTYVADHYQYNASIGLIAVFAALAWHYLGRSSFWRPLQAALLLLLVGLTWHQCAPYRNLETLWRDTLAKNPNSWMAHHNLGIEFFKAGQMDAALDQYRIAVTLYPQGDREQSDLGTALMEQGVYPEAIQHLEAALAINPKLFPAQNSLALAYSKTGDYDQAMAHFQQALQIQPDSLGVRLNLGSVLKRQGKLVEAAEDYRTAIKQFPSEVEPRRRLTAVLVQQGDFSQAADACREALQLSPTDSNLWLQLGNIFLAENNYAAAADGYRRALQIDPTSAGLHYNLGLVLGMQGQISLERQELMTALQLKPDFAPAQQELQSLNSSPAK